METRFFPFLAHCLVGQTDTHTHKSQDKGKGAIKEAVSIP